MNRRDILKSFASASILPSLALETHSAEKSAPVSKSGKNISWALGIVTWVTLREPKVPSVVEILDDIVAAGFEGIEIFRYDWFMKGNGIDEERLKVELTKRNLKLSGIYMYGDFYDSSKHEALLKEAYSVLKNLKFFGSNRMLIGPPGNPGTGKERELINIMGKFLSQIGKIALEEYNIKVGIHPHWDSFIENPRQIDDLMESADPRYFFFAPDTAQIWMAGGDPLKMIDKYKEQLVYLHYKDATGYVTRDGWLGNERELGRGEIDFPAMHEILKIINYEGWITIDLGKAPKSPLESSKISKAYIDQILEKIYR